MGGDDFYIDPSKLNQAKYAKLQPNLGTKIEPAAPSPPFHLRVVISLVYRWKPI